MNLTKNMVIILTTLFITWMVLSTLFFFFGDYTTFKAAATDSPVGMLMLVFGWIPSVVVGADLAEKAQKRNYPKTF